MDVIRVTTGDLAYDVLPTRGMGIWKVWLRGEEIGWRSPVRGPVHPGFVPLMEPGGLGWLDGFDELLVRCGLESNGSPDFDAAGRLRYPLHGRIANRPAHQVSVSIDGDSGEITVTGVVEETRFHFRKLRLTSSVTTAGRANPASASATRWRTSPAARPRCSCCITSISASRCWIPAPASLRRSRRSSLATRAAEGIATWDAYAPEVAGYPEQVYFLELLSGQRRAHADAVEERPEHARREHPSEHAAAALLHAVEEHDLVARRLRDRPGAGHQLPESADLRRPTGPDGQAGSGRQDGVRSASGRAREPRPKSPRPKPRSPHCKRPSRPRPSTNPNRVGVC